MKSLTGILTCSIFFCHFSYAQNGNYNSGARALGISGTCITISDAFSAFNNIGALASQKGLKTYFTSSLLYGFPGLLKVAAGLNGEVLKGIGTINFYRFGDDLLNEHKLGLGFSHKIHYISIGLQLNYIQYRIEGYGSTGNVSIEFGGVVEICPEIKFGAYIFRPVKSNTDPDSGGLLPTFLKTGLSYRPVRNLMLNVEYHYCIFKRHYLSFGIEYLVREKISLRTGMNLETLRSTFGIGFCPGKLRLDYAIDIHPLLGISHEFTTIVNIKKK